MRDHLAKLIQSKEKEIAKIEHFIKIQGGRSEFHREIAFNKIIKHKAILRELNLQFKEITFSEFEEQRSIYKHD